MKKRNKSWFQKGHKLRVGMKHSDESKRKMSESQKGRKVSKETRLKMSISHSGKNHPFFGKHFSEEHKQSLSDSHKGQIPWNKGIHLTEEHRKSLVIGSKKRKEKYGYIHSQETIRKLREAQSKYLDGVRLNSGILYPCVGKYETPILNNLENCFGYEILRQYKVAGYFLDGYCPALNLAIEIDEKHHNKPEHLNKDQQRETEIQKNLNCQFLRIKVGDYCAI